MPIPPSELGINLGYKCNFSCAHCAVQEPRSLRLSRREENLLAATIKKHHFKSLLFVGGEPTLFIPSANRILRKAGDLSGISVRVTTNGHFADNRDGAVKVLSSFVKLDKVLLSYDRFHAEFLPFHKIGVLYKACRELKIRFVVSVAIGSPMDLMLIGKIRQTGRFPIVIQKVLPVGRARLNNVAHRYPSFDSSVLKKRCPNLRTLMYFCGRGFSVCCSSLVYDSGMSGVVHPSVQEHLASDFYRTVAGQNLGRFAARLGITAARMLPEHSAPCILCAHLFKLAEERGEMKA